MKVFPSLKKLSLTAVPFFLNGKRYYCLNILLSMNIVQIIVRDFDFWSLCRVNSLARSLAALSSDWPVGRPDDLPVAVSSSGPTPHLKEIPFKLVSYLRWVVKGDKDPSLFIINKLEFIFEVFFLCLQLSYEK